MGRDRTLRLRLKAIDKMSATIDRVQSKFPKLSRSVRRASRTIKIFNAQTKSMRAALTKVGRGMKSFGRSLSMFVTLPLIAAAGASLKFFGDFEQGLRGIEKTTGLLRPEVAKLGKVFDQLSTEIPVSTKEMLELAEAAGQLGVSGAKELEKFTLVMAKLSRASDVAGAEGAKAIARILKVTGEGVGVVDKFAASLVGLGNKAAASETEILGIATRIALATGDFEVGSAAILGMAAAMKSMGILAESGGTVIGKTFRRISKIIAKGGRDFTALQEITGMSGDVLKKTFETNASKVFRSFLEGLAKLRAKGAKTTLMLEEFGLIGERVNAVIPVMVKNVGLVGKELERSAKLWKENTALQKEFQIQTESFNSEMKILTNTFVSLLTMIGAELAPAISFFGKILKDIFNFLRNNPTIRTLVIVFGALAAVLGPLLFLFGGFLLILPGLSAGMLALSTASLPITGTFLAISAAIVGLIALTVFLVKNWDKVKLAMVNNPFGRALIFIAAMVDSLGKLINFVTFANSSFGSLKTISERFGDLKASLGFGDKREKLGPAIGAREKNKGIAAQNIERTNNASVKVDFSAVPFGTKISSNVDDFSSFDLGIAGAIQ